MVKKQSEIKSYSICKLIFRLYIHSAIGEHRTTIGKVWLHHAIYSIVYVEK